ncbi:hypothetical protein [Paenibacillus sp. DMB20]|uniref:hypothetical protein n=1 Tax=Paenibacillus sp. DMB20 TaxID=1642570 RepID=UPI000A531B72|nr:hypothetical protein [Paenibacillus sp. DMB20]
MIGKRFTRKWLALMLVMVLPATMLAPASMQGAALEPMTPDYELKVFLDPAVVLDGDKKLKSDVMSYFNMSTSPEKMAVQFMDTENLELNQAGWSVRIRKKEDYSDEKFELVYKKRYPIVNGDIDGALMLAASEGFEADDTNYEAQVDWGYQKQTLSISRKKTIKKSGYDGMELPTPKDSRNWTIAEAPGKFDDWLGKGWGTTRLAEVHKPKGPVEAKRHVGTWNGSETYVEVWQLLNSNGTGFDYIVEASFKLDSYDEAAAKKADFEADMAAAGWFLPVDQLKTQLILERY